MQKIVGPFGQLAEVGDGATFEKGFGFWGGEGNNAGYCFSLAGHERMNSAWDYNPIDIQLEGVISYSQVYKGGVSMQAYCMKCRTKREMNNPKAVKMKNGKPATQGTCPKCGTKMFRIGKS